MVKKLENLNILDQICPVSVIPIKSKINEHYHSIQQISVSLGTKFNHNKTVLLFWTKFAQKGCFQSKREKLNIPIEFSTLSTQFHFNNFDYLGQICRKKYFPFKAE